MSECPEDVLFSWISLEDKPLYAQAKFSSKESVLIYNSVTKEHENEIQCRARCKGVPKQAKATIKVYCKYTLKLLCSRGGYRRLNIHTCKHIRTTKQQVLQQEKQSSYCNWKKKCFRLQATKTTKFNTELQWSFSTQHLSVVALKCVRLSDTL